MKLSEKCASEQAQNKYVNGIMNGGRIKVARERTAADMRIAL